MRDALFLPRPGQAREVPHQPLKGVHAQNPSIPGGRPSMPVAWETSSRIFSFSRSRASVIAASTRSCSMGMSRGSTASGAIVDLLHQHLAVHLHGDQSAARGAGDADRLQLFLDLPHAGLQSLELLEHLKRIGRHDLPLSRPRRGTPSSASSTRWSTCAVSVFGLAVGEANPRDRRAGERRTAR